MLLISANANSSLFCISLTLPPTTSSIIPRHATIGYHLYFTLPYFLLYSNISDDTCDAMNIEPTYMQEHQYAPVSSPPQCTDRATPKGDFLGQMIPPLLKNVGGLGNIPPETLRENLQPIVRALQKLDAELLLGLERSARGPQVREG